MNKFKESCRFLGRDPTKFLRQLLLLDLVLIAGCVFLGLYFKQTMLLAIGFASVALYDFLAFNSLQKEVEKRHDEHESEFIVALGVFRVFAANKFNVYNAFSETRAFVSPWMKETLDILLKEMDEDKSVTPFIHFAKRFRPLIIEQVMTSVFQIVDGGSLTPLLQFSILFDHFAESHMKEEMKKNEDRLDMMNVWPLMGAGLLAVAVIIGVVQIIGGVINEL